MHTRTARLLVAALVGGTAVAVAPVGDAVAATTRASTVNIADNFDRPALANGGQAATIGGQYTVSSGAGLTRSGGTGHFTSAAAAQTSAVLQASRTDEEIALSFAVTSAPSTGTAYYGTILRQQGTSTVGYYARVKWNAADASGTLQVTAPTGITAASALIPGFAPGSAYTLTARVVGSGASAHVSAAIAKYDSATVLARLDDVAITTSGYTTGQFGMYAYSGSAAIAMDVYRLLGVTLVGGEVAQVPDATTTGNVTPRADLTTYPGPYPASITQSVSGMRFTGQVVIKADNVTISDSVVEANTEGMIVNQGYDNAVIKDVTFDPSAPTVDTYGFTGTKTTLLNVDISQVVDAVNANYGGDVNVYNSYLHGLIHYDVDPRQTNGSHNDIVQSFGYAHLVVAGNALEGMMLPTTPDGLNYSGSVWQTSQTRALATDQVWTHNLISGGACSINLSPKTQSGTTPAMTGITITYNRFGPDAGLVVNGQPVQCYIIALSTTVVTGARRASSPADPNNPLLNTTLAGAAVTISRGD